MENNGSKIYYFLLESQIYVILFILLFVIIGATAKFDMAFGKDTGNNVTTSSEDMTANNFISGTDVYYEILYIDDNIDVSFGGNRYTPEELKKLREKGSHEILGILSLNHTYEKTYSINRDGEITCINYRIS